MDKYDVTEDSLLRGYARKERVEIETTDRLVLETLPTFLIRPLRCASPESSVSDEVILDDSLGEIQVTTTLRTFILGISRGGFTLEAKAVTYRNSFQSWGLATLIDDILRRHGKPGITEPLFLDLSPSGWIEVEKHVWKRMQAECKQPEPARKGEQK